MSVKINYQNIHISLLVKFIAGISLATGLVYYLVLQYINFDYEKVAINESKTSAQKIAQSYGLLIQAELNGIFHDMRALRQAYSIHNKIPLKNSRVFFDAVLQKFVYENSKYISVWDSWEYRFINPNYTKNYGRVKTVFFRKGNYIFNVVDSVNFDGDIETSMYYKIKSNPIEFITEPYFYRLGDTDVLMTSLGCPIIINHQFAGLVGVDIAISDLSTLVDTIKPFEGARAFLLSHEGIFITHPNRDLIGKSILELDSTNAIQHNIIQRLNNYELVDYEQFSPNLRKRLYTVFVPFKLAETGHIWALGISMPLTTIVENVKNHIQETRKTAMLGFIVLLVVTILIAVRIIRPLQKTTKALTILAHGDIDNVEKLYIRTGDEIESISNSVNKIITGLKQTYQFAEKIRKGDFDAPFNPMSNKDILGISILEMRNSLVRADKEKQKRKHEEDQKIWISQGLNYFSVVLREDNDNLHKLSTNIINNLVDYTKVHAGAIYLVEQSGGERYLQVYASCGFPKERLNKNIVYPNEGPVGRCMLEKETIFMDDIPKDFTYISSGLGRSIPKALLIVPLVVNEEIVGVLEIESLKPIEEYVNKFVETVAIPIAATISTVRINVRTAKLLHESQVQADELAQQEEEMRQNMEEMQATQEEAAKREDQYIKLISALSSAVIYLEYDPQGNITHANDNLLQLFKLSKDQVVGKKIGSYEFNSREKTEYRNKFWERLSNGEIISQEFYSKYLGEEYWLYETYIPIFDPSGEFIKVVNIAFDISEEKRKEQQIQKLKAKLERVKIAAEKRKLEILEGKENKPFEKRTLERVFERSHEFKYIRLNHLNKVYKGDVDKIQHILKVYVETIPKLIEEMRQLLLEQRNELFKSRITSFKSKMTYLGLDAINNLLKQLDQLAITEKHTFNADPIFEEINDIWEQTEEEINQILSL